jgi:hypothetical protein
VLLLSAKVILFFSKKAYAILKILKEGLLAAYKITNG